MDLVEGDTQTRVKQPQDQLVPDVSCASHSQHRALRCSPLTLCCYHWTTVQWVGSIFERGLRDALGVSAKAASGAHRTMPQKDLAQGRHASRRQQKWPPFPGPVSSSAASVRKREQ